MLADLNWCLDVTLKEIDNEIDWSINILLVIDKATRYT